MNEQRLLIYFVSWTMSSYKKYFKLLFFFPMHGELHHQIEYTIPFTTDEATALAALVEL